LHVNQQILKTFCLLQVTDFFDTFLLELELELELEPEPPELKSLGPEPEPPKWAAPTTLLFSQLELGASDHIAVDPIQVLKTFSSLNT